MNDEHKRNLPVPYFNQRENKYIWQYQNAQNQPEGSKVTLAYETCNITSLCMILHYFGITNDIPDVMLDKFYKTKYNGSNVDLFHTNNGYTRVELVAYLKEFVNKVYHVPEGYMPPDKLSILLIKEEIKKGNPVWISYGILSTQGAIAEDPENKWHGHIAVVRGFTQNDDIIVNDPWGDPVKYDGTIRTTTNNEQIRGVYENSTYSNRGSGDNAVIRKESFDEIFNSYSTIVIRYRHIWSFPVRDTGQDCPWYFSTVADDYKISKLREDRVTRMLRKEKRENACYPITPNGRWHNGIHIEKIGGTPVYAVGPGRLVVIRAVESKSLIDKKLKFNGYVPSSCFALLRHPVTAGDNETSFFSFYMHLAPLTLSEIRERIAARFSFNTAFETGDWLDQILQHIQGLRVIIKYGNANSGTISTATPQAYSRSGNDFTPCGPLANREMIFLCPINEEDRESLYNINLNNEDGLEILFNNLNKISTYENSASTTGYYRIFNRKLDERSDGSLTGKISYEDRYIEKNDSVVIPLKLNNEEFVYWRKKLAAILRGEVVPLNDEDSDIRSRIANTVDYTVDYHIEVNNRTKLGVIGNHEKDILHFEIFSDENIIEGANDTNFTTTISISEEEKKKYFDNHHTVKILKEAGLFPNNFKWRSLLNFNMISQKDYLNYYLSLDGCYKLQRTICQHLNGYMIKNEQDWIEIVQNASGTFNYDDDYIDLALLSSGFYSNDVLKAMRLKIETGSVTPFFYHPVRFLAWLDKNMNEK